MSDPSEHDDRCLARSVHRFRRVARLANLDPLRLLAADPLVRLGALEAPMMALTEIALFEVLHTALATVEPARRGGASQRPAPPLLPSSTAGRQEPLAKFPVAASRSTAVTDARSRNADREAAARRENEGLRREGLAQRQGEGQWREEWPRRTTSAALAQRRAALRRSTLQPGDVARAASSTSTKAAAPNTMATVTPFTGDAALGDLRSEEMNAAADFAPLLGTADTPASPHLDQNALTSLLRTDRVAGSDTDRANRSAPGFALPPGFRLVEDAAMRSPSPATGAISSSPIPGETPGQGSRDSVHSPKPLEGSASAPSRSSQSWNRYAGLDLTDDLFEVLYRNGVDLSWP